MAQPLSFQVVPLLFFLGAACVLAIYPETATLGIVRKKITADGVNLPPELKLFNYTQTLDHFNYKPESYNTFQHRYIVNSEYWGGANGSYPIILYTGAEEDMTYEVSAAGFVPQIASRLKALLVYIEHRYYGSSMPFGSEEEAFQNASTLGFLSSEQALADYAQLIIDLKRNMSAENCPVVAVGASYGGMLASWFRLKYPHVVYAALASSAPILYFGDITPQNAYRVTVSKDYNDTSQSCYNTIRESWFEIDKVAAEAGGLLKLSHIFNTCQPLNSSQELKTFLGLLYKESAQYDYPPDYWVERVCGWIDGAVEGTYILDRIVAGLKAFHNGQCFHVFDLHIGANKSAWEWQSCTELVIPMGNGANDTIFQADPFDIDQYTKSCQDLFGISPRPQWITTEFGGHRIDHVLKNFASNIIFSNGLRDPWSAGGVLQNITDTVLAIHTEKGAHVLDLLTPNSTSDPEWLVAQRDTDLKILEGWISGYIWSYWPGIGWGDQKLQGGW